MSKLVAMHSLDAIHKTGADLHIADCFNLQQDTCRIYSVDAWLGGACGGSIPTCFASHLCIYSQRSTLNTHVLAPLSAN